MLTLGNTTAHGRAPPSNNDNHFLVLAACNLIAISYILMRAARRTRIVSRLAAHICWRRAPQGRYETLGNRDDIELGSSEPLDDAADTENRARHVGELDQNRFFVSKPSLIRRILEAPSWRFSIRHRWAQFIHKRTNINRLSERMRQRARHISFTDHASEGTHVDTEHPHGVAASYRRQSSRLVQQFANENKQVVAAYQSSLREHRHGAKASRDVYVKASDFQQAPTPFHWDAHIYQFIDVIDYVTRPELALFRGKTLAVYTNQQRTLCERTDETVSYWEDENTLVECVKGGAVYRQQPWDFTKDVFIITGATGFTIYNVERVQQPHSTRQLVFAIPTTEINMPYWLYKWGNNLCGLPAELEPLQKMTVQEVNGLLTSAHGGERLMAPLSAPQEAVAVPNKVLAAAQLSSETTLGGLRRSFRESGVPYNELTIASASRLVQAGGGTVMRDSPNFMYSFAGQDGAPKAALAIPSNGLEGAACVRSTAEVAVSVKNLIELPENLHKFTKEQKGFATEFINIVKASCDVLQPATEEEIIDDLKRANQIAKYKRAFHYPGEPKNVIDAMQKIENSSAQKPSRVICPGDVKFNIWLARYVKVASKHLASTFDPYVVGCEPAEVTRRLTEAMGRLKTLHETDYTTMDATLNSEFRRFIEIPLLIALFHNSCTRDIACLGNKLKTVKLGYEGEGGERKWVDMNGRNCSGLSDTTFYNTVVNMFIDFSQKRMDGHPPDRAFQLIGPKSGDDGLASSDITKASRAYGLTVKINSVSTIKQPEPLGFCGRIYVDLNRTASSIHDPVRAMTRIPTCVPQGKTVRQAHQNRVLGYMKEAQGTLLYEYASAVKRCCGYSDELVCVNADDEFLKLPPYPFDAMYLQDALSATANKLDITLLELLDYIAALKRANTVGDLERLKKFVAEGPKSHYRW